MKKGLMIFLGVVIALVLVIVIARNVIVRVAVERVAQQVTGLDLNIGSMDIGLAGTDLRLERVRLMNPPDFPDAAMLEVPELYVNYNLGDLLGKKIHLSELVLHVEEFTVVKNKEGKLNVNALKTTREEEAKPEQPPEEAGLPDMNIEQLHLKIGKVIYKDYTAGEEPRVQEFNINIDETYEDITDPRALVNLIVLKALAKTTLASLLDLNFLQNTVTGAVGTVTDITTGVAGEALEQTGKTIEKTGDVIQKSTEEIKKLLPFGGGEEK